MDDFLPLVSVLSAMAILKRNKNKNRSVEELERMRIEEERLEARRVILQAEKDKAEREEMERAPRAFRRRALREKQRNQ